MVAPAPKQLLSGKGLWLERLASIEGGRIDAAIARAVEAGLSHVILKIADGADGVNLEAAPLVSGLQANGVAVWGWQRAYGQRPAYKTGGDGDYHRREADAAVLHTSRLGLNGLVIEARAEYEAPGSDQRAVAYMAAIRTARRDLPCGLTAWSTPTAHPRFPWAEFRAECELDLPFLFWVDRVYGAQLTTILRLFAGLKPMRPLVPVGPAFVGGRWRPSAEALAQFLSDVYVFGQPAVNVWKWDDLCQPEFRDHWTAVALTHWPAASPARWSTNGASAPPPTLAPRQPPPANLAEAPPASVAHPAITRLFKALRLGQLSEAVSEYAPGFVHVSRHQVSQSAQDVAAFYQRALTAVRPHTLAIEAIATVGRAITVDWFAQSAAGEFRHGRDAFHLNRHGQIVYHDSALAHPA